MYLTTHLSAFVDNGNTLGIDVETWDGSITEPFKFEETISSGYIDITNKGLFMYENFYSKPILEDIKDPFDLFFEETSDFDSLRRLKNEKLEVYEKSNMNPNTS